MKINNACGHTCDIVAHCECAESGPGTLACTALRLFKRQYFRRDCIEALSNSSGLIPHSTSYSTSQCGLPRSLSPWALRDVVEPQISLSRSSPFDDLKTYFFGLRQHRTRSRSPLSTHLLLPLQLQQIETGKSPRTVSKLMSRYRLRVEWPIIFPPAFTYR